MEHSDGVVEGWLQLKKHWEIPPYAPSAPSTPAYSILRLFLAPLLRPMLRWKIRGAGNIPRKGATILAANHLSHVDPIAVIAAARRTTHYLAKDGHFSKPMVRFFMQATGQIETQREKGGNEALASAATVLSSGRALGIFPEGTRSKRTEAPFLLPGKTGVARLAAAYPDARVVPLAIRGSRQFMKPQEHKFPRLWRPMSINAGASVSWHSWLGHEAGGNHTLESLKTLSQLEDHEIRSELARLYRDFTDQLMGSLQALGAP
ncbi:MAG: 1-acyl-sn-glycerol-3-phosphate acyltransferase [Euryarchaeota archaeon]|nr:1-acyl-sn-glycerol-3-phosphate acyltransferase [Euryarchaeota archaeon]